MYYFFQQNVNQFKSNYMQLIYHCALKLPIKTWIFNYTYSLWKLVSENIDSAAFDVKLKLILEEEITLLCL